MGIVTLLIAILLPAVGKARKHAQEVRCAAHLRSIGQALFGYTQQYGYYPGCHTGGVAIWPVRLRPFLRGDRAVFNCPAQDERFHWTDTGPGGFTMPATDWFEPFGYEPGEPVITTGSFFTYGYNQWGTGDRGRDSRWGLGNRIMPGGDPRAHVDPETPYGHIHASRVVVPADMIAIADSIPDGSWDFAIDGPIDPGWGIGFPRGFPGTIHRGGANVLFCDGHVQWFLQRDLVDYSGRDGQARRRRWHNDHQPTHFQGLF